MILKDQASKPRTGPHIDKIISCEIPDPVQDPELYEIVKTCMIHGPCGTHNPDSPCMKSPKSPGICKAGFPRSYCETTNADKDGYPEYKRPEGGPVIDVLGRHLNVDCRWVVPYNPYLSKLLNCHVNVEISTSILSIKYIYKYVYKGGDRAEFTIRLSDEVETADIDEIKNYQDARYLSSCEAVWRIFGFPMSCKSHMVERLPIHLPNEQTVVFLEGTHNLVAEAPPKGTMLTAYFKLNQSDSERHVEHRQVQHLSS